MSEEKYCNVSLEKFQDGMNLIAAAKRALANDPTVFRAKPQVQQLLKQAKDAFRESQQSRAALYEQRTGKPFPGKKSMWNSVFLGFDEFGL